LRRRFRSRSRDSSVGLATGYGLDGRGIGVRFLSRSRDMSLLHSFQTGSEAYPASYTMGTGDSFPGVKAPGGMKLTSHLNLVPRSRTVELCLHSPIDVFMTWCIISAGKALPLPCLPHFTLEVGGIAQIY
jgi:hypothetical protein